MSKRVQSLLSILLSIDGGLEVELLSRKLNDEALNDGGYRFILAEGKLISFLLDRDLKTLCREGVLDVQDRKYVVKNKEKALNLSFCFSGDEDNRSHFVLQDKIANKGEMNGKTNRLYTIGYESIEVDDFFSRLVLHEIHTLIDVRKNPISRKYGFSKGALVSFCAQLGIQYIHFPELGVPADLRRDLKSESDYKKLFDKYEEIILSTETNRLNEIQTMSQRESCALMCFEAVSRFCHRHKIAEFIEEQTDVMIVDI